MTRKELASQIRSLDRKFKQRIFIVLTIIGLWMIGGTFLDNLLHWGGSTFLRQAYVVLGCAIFVAFLLVLAVSQVGVPCPRCKKRLFSVPGQIAVATGNCGYCGEKAFEG